MITVEWRDYESAYIVEQDEEFIGDFEDILKALRFAVEVGDNTADHVSVIQVEP